MSDLFTQQGTMPELFKTGEDIAKELKAQTVEPNTATDLLLNSDKNIRIASHFSCLKKGAV